MLTNLECWLCFRGRIYCRVSLLISSTWLLNEHTCRSSHKAEQHWCIAIENGQLLWLVPLETVVQGLEVPVPWNSDDSDTSQWRNMGGQISHLPWKNRKTDQTRTTHCVIRHASNNLEFSLWLLLKWSWYSTF